MPSREIKKINLTSRHIFLFFSVEFHFKVANNPNANLFLSEINTKHSSIPFDEVQCSNFHVFFFLLYLNFNNIYQILHPAPFDNTSRTFVLLIWTEIGVEMLNSSFWFFHFWFQFVEIVTNTILVCLSLKSVFTFSISVENEKLPWNGKWISMLSIQLHKHSNRQQISHLYFGSMSI